MQQALRRSGGVGRYGRRPPFELISFDLTSGCNNSLQARGTGKLNGVSVDMMTLTVNTSGPTLETFDWDNQVVFHWFGGANAGINGQGTEFVPDNLTTSPAVFDQRPLARRPEPSTLALLLLGFAWPRRRSKAKSGRAALAAEHGCGMLARRAHLGGGRRLNILCAILRATKKPG